MPQSEKERCFDAMPRAPNGMGRCPPFLRSSHPESRENADGKQSDHDLIAEGSADPKVFGTEIGREPDGDYGDDEGHENQQVQWSHDTSFARSGKLLASVRPPVAPAAAGREV